MVYKTLTAGKRKKQPEAIQSLKNEILFYKRGKIDFSKAIKLGKGRFCEWNDIQACEIARVNIASLRHFSNHAQRRKIQSRASVCLVSEFSRQPQSSHLQNGNISAPTQQMKEKHSCSHSGAGVFCPDAEHHVHQAGRKKGEPGCLRSYQSYRLLVESTTHTATDPQRPCQPSSPAGSPTFYTVESEASSTGLQCDS